ncbi:MAG: helix-turn-helix domain-containing protein [Lachnospiraceae bacterium]|nr:helix-turn-helix domain-containing protein [Lachnospiraceae bacterium]
MNQIKIGEFLKELRKEKRLTQEQLAEQFNVSRRSVSRWETGNNMPDLDTLIELADYYEIDLRELLDGERKSEKMNEELKETVLKVAEYSTNEKEMKRKKLNKCFIIGGLCFLFVIINHQFGVLAMVFHNPIDDFMAGALTGLGILFEFVGFYNNNHEVSLKQRKQELFRHNNL